MFSELACMYWNYLYGCTVPDLFHWVLRDLSLRTSIVSTRRAWLSPEIKIGYRYTLGYFKNYWAIRPPAQAPVVVVVVVAVQGLPESGIRRPCPVAAPKVWARQ